MDRKRRRGGGRNLKPMPRRNSLPPAAARPKPHCGARMGTHARSRDMGSQHSKAAADERKKETTFGTTYESEETGEEKKKREVSMARHGKSGGETISHSPVLLPSLPLSYGLLRYIWTGNTRGKRERATLRP